MQDYADLIQTHRKSNADITIATHAVGQSQASFRGCCKVEDSGHKSRTAPPFRPSPARLYACSHLCCTLLHISAGAPVTATLMAHTALSCSCPKQSSRHKFGFCQPHRIQKICFIVLNYWHSISKPLFLHCRSREALMFCQYCCYCCCCL